MAVSSEYVAAIRQRLRLTTDDFDNELPTSSTPPAQTLRSAVLLRKKRMTKLTR